MELGRLIKVNFQGDCFWKCKYSSDASWVYKDLYNLSKKDEKYFDDGIKINFNFESIRSWISSCFVNHEGLNVAHAMALAFLYSLESSKKKLIFTSTEIVKLTREEYEGLLKKADEASSIRFCKIKVTGSPNFDYVFCFVKDEGDFPKTIAEYFKKLQEKHPRKYKNLKYRIQFTGKF